MIERVNLFCSVFVRADLNKNKMIALIRYTFIALVSLMTCLNVSTAQEIFEFQIQPKNQSSSQPTNKTHLFPTLPLLEQYRGEETQGVRYLSFEERSQRKLVVKEGKLVDLDHQPLNQKHSVPPDLVLSHFPDQPPVSQTQELGFAIYVMNTSGEILVSFEAEAHKFHHSSLAGGHPIAAAGEMIIFQGKLYAINNRSGHYRPPPVTLERVIKVLKEQGINFDGVLIKKYGSDF